MVEGPLSLGQSRGDGLPGGKELMQRNHQRGCLGVRDRHDGGDDVTSAQREKSRAETHELVSCFNR